MEGTSSPRPRPGTPASDTYNNNNDSQSATTSQDESSRPTTPEQSDSDKGKARKRQRDPSPKSSKSKQRGGKKKKRTPDPKKLVKSVAPLRIKRVDDSEEFVSSETSDNKDEEHDDDEEEDAERTDVETTSQSDQEKLGEMETVGMETAPLKDGHISAYDEDTDIDENHTHEVMDDTEGEVESRDTANHQGKTPVSPRDLDDQPEMTEQAEPEVASPLSQHLEEKAAEVAAEEPEPEVKT